MSRQVVLDTETTGLEPTQGHRIIEIGCIELKNRRRTERVFHQYLNPERDIEEGAFGVHGIRAADLAEKPLFKSIAAEFIAFIHDSEVIIHNAPFDVAFINNELERLGKEWGRLEDHCTVTDTLRLARELYPGQKNSLDALCARYAVDNSRRDVHGALLDARILSDIYLAMTGGQASLLPEEHAAVYDGGIREHNQLEDRRRRLRTIGPNAEELAAHRRRLETIDRASGGRCLWRGSAPESK